MFDRLYSLQWYMQCQYYTMWKYNFLYILSFCMIVIKELETYLLVRRSYLFMKGFRDWIQTLKAVKGIMECKLKVKHTRNEWVTNTFTPGRCKGIKYKIMSSNSVFHGNWIFFFNFTICYMLLWGIVQWIYDLDTRLRQWRGWYKLTLILFT